jgi:Domain of unknown function (DUF4070)
MVEAIHKIHSYNMFVSAGMIVGFDQDDASIFDEQFEFLQAAQIPVAMLSVLIAVPRTPLFKRLDAAGRIPHSDDYTRYVGTGGGTNFEPLQMTRDELRRGQANLYRRLYAPEAFATRLLGNLSRFHDVTYRPEPLQLAKLATLVRLARYYWRQGKAGRRFFFGIIAKTLRHSPRSLRLVVTMLGMYKHFCELHPEATEEPVAAPPPLLQASA